MPTPRTSSSIDDRAAAVAVADARARVQHRVAREEVGQRADDVIVGVVFGGQDVEVREALVHEDLEAARDVTEGREGRIRDCSASTTRGVVPSQLPVVHVPMLCANAVYDARHGREAGGAAKGDHRNVDVGRPA